MEFCCRGLSSNIFVAVLTITTIHSECEILILFFSIKTLSWEIPSLEICEES